MGKFDIQFRPFYPDSTTLPMTVYKAPNLRHLTPFHLSYTSQAHAYPPYRRPSPRNKQKEPYPHHTDSNPQQKQKEGVVHVASMFSHWQCKLDRDHYTTGPVATFLTIFPRLVNYIGRLQKWFCRTRRKWGNVMAGWGNIERLGRRAWKWKRGVSWVKEVKCFVAVVLT